MAVSHESRLAGGLYGLLLGDAVGVPYEFHAPHQLPAKAQLELEPPADFVRSHRGVPPGTWSDDGAQALCLLESLLEHNTLDLPDFSRRMLAWEHSGHLAVDNTVFDIGNQTYRAFRVLESGMPPELAGPSGIRNNGNGSLMRVLPLALWHTGTDAELVALAHRQSLPTHGHAYSQVCCALYCLVAREALAGTPLTNAWDAAIARLQPLYGAHPHGQALDEVLAFRTRELRTGSGYVVDSLWSAYDATLAPSFEDVVKSAIAFGNDTDTTACIAGGLAGIQFGIDGIPPRWLSALRGTELVQPLLIRLLEKPPVT